MTVKEFYESINCDYQVAINMMMMDEFIKRMLGKFVANNASPDLFLAYEKHDYPGVFAAAHSLKGVTGNLALTALFNKIVPVVEATRNKDANASINIDKEVNDYKSEYEFVVSQIEKFLKQ